MGTHLANGDSHLSFWPRVREFAVPPTMIETATARRRAGDWAGACAAAGFDVDLDLRATARTHGRELAARIRTDLRHLAPDLLRWHLPRIAPDGLLRPGLTLTLARHTTPAGRAVHLVARTAPAWADAGQRVSLALWDGTRPEPGGPSGPRSHPHPRPNRRFRLDLHRHLWDARRSGELGIRSGAGLPSAGPHPVPDASGGPPHGPRPAVGRWAEEAALLLRAEGRSAGTVLVRCGARRRLLLDVVADGDGPPSARITPAPARADITALPVLPDAATWVPPDLELLRAGAVEAGRLHPLVAAALVPGRVPDAPPREPEAAGRFHLVECRDDGGGGPTTHRIGLVDGVLVPLDHDPDTLRREELLAALTGTPLPCLQAVDEAHRRPDCLTGVRERLDHGDTAGALAVVEGLLGAGAALRDGPLRDALETAARRRIAHGMYRAGLTGAGPAPVRVGAYARPRDRRARPRHATLN
ncbi:MULTISPECIES: hypothetical protein [Streptomyces]|uniref:hypothetical protein n=1 Tax=Streptomyces TaxID=1883 RepID=UPI00163BD96C|nr:MULTISPECIES: hypothetical protein [Streptomyces]MBC2878661.1 hypothetical protein [Streptomyces sp. TYQ1024]UBI35107.1 hypothetical protein K7I03_00665 [Streptomyces mobaraensis]UKW27701.1 hypothetical protein MCU78_00710 [Streptomyces sp. TYQ1024]